MPLSPDQIYTEYPLGIRMVLLMQYENPKGDYIQDVLPYNKAASKLEDIIVARNNQGTQYEKELRIDEAIDLYETNIADLVDTPHPYERLRIIYTKRKQYDEAIRVCQAYIYMCNTLENAILKEFSNNKLAQQLGDTGDFESKIVKLNRLAGRDDAGFITPPSQSNQIVQNTSTTKMTVTPETTPNKKRPLILYAAIAIIACCILTIIFGSLLPEPEPTPPPPPTDTPLPTETPPPTLTPAQTYLEEYGGMLAVYIEILSTTDCTALQTKFDIASENNAREQAGTDLYRITLGYMTATDEHMRAIGCY